MVIVPQHTRRLMLSVPALQACATMLISRVQGLHVSDLLIPPPLPCRRRATPPDKWFLYPEQDASSDYYLPVIAKRPSFGIAVSGGGYRAVTLALGYVR